MQMQHPLDDVVADTLRRLVKHFSEEVHVVEENPPYFDTLLGSPAPDSVVLKLFLDRLASLPKLALSKWIAGYATSISPLFREQGVGCVQILQNYELIIAKWINDLDRSCQCETSELPHYEQHVCKALQALTDDLAAVSTTRNNPLISGYTRCNILLPTLLRILSHTIRFSSLLCQKGQGTIIDNGTVLKCSIAAIPFLRPQLSPNTLCAPLINEEATKSVFRFCQSPPPDSLLKHIPCHVSFAKMDWASVTLDSTNIFNDPGTGIVARAADEVWASLFNMCHEQAFCDPSSTVASSSPDLPLEKMSPVYFLRSKGIGSVARAIRDHFFCLGSGAIRTQSMCIDFMGRHVEKQQQRSIEVKTFEEEPIRIHAALNFVSLVTDEDICSSNDVIAALVPLILELLQSNNAVYAAMGASAIIHLLFVMDRTNIIWKQVGGQILAKLEIAFKTHKEIPVIFLIGRAQYEIVRTVGGSPQQHRRLCRQWMKRLCQSTLLSKSQDECWALLCAGVVPLLHQLASQGESDGIEIGRLGLQALLPLLHREIVDVTVETHILALVALINLLCSASAMMPSHGGKIICHTLSSRDAIVGNRQIKIGMRKLYNYTAAVCLVVCGTHADAILTQIMLLKEEYQKDFVTRVTDVRKLAAELRETCIKPP